MALVSSLVASPAVVSAQTGDAGVPATRTDAGVEVVDAGEGQDTEPSQGADDPPSETPEPDANPVRPRRAPVALPRVQLSPEDAAADSEREDESSPDPSDEAPPEVDDAFLDAMASASLEALLSGNVIESSTGAAQRTEEAPSIIAVITAAQIRRRGYRTVGEALRHVPGLAVIYDQNTYDVGVRGMHGAPNAPNEMIKFLINGMSIAVRSTGASNIGRELIPMEAIRQIEVLRSPGSALYGANAFLAVVNIITLQRGTAANPLRTHSITAEGYLSNNPQDTTFNGGASFASGMDIGDFHYFVSGSFHRGDRSGLVLPGFNDIVLREVAPAADASSYTLQGLSPGWTLEHRQFLLRNAVSRNDTEWNGSFYGIASLDLGEDFVVQVDGSLQVFDRAVEFASFGPLTHGSRLTMLNGYARLLGGYRMQATRGLVGNVSVAVASGSPTGEDRILDYRTPGIFRRPNYSYLAVDVAGEISYAFGSENLTNPADLRLNLGVDVSHSLESLYRVDTYDAGTNARLGVGPGFGERDFTNVGVYAQGLWNPFYDGDEGLSFTLGARGDYNTVIACDSREWDCFGSRGEAFYEIDGDNFIVEDRGILQLSARAAAVYNFPWVGLYAKLIYSSSFKPPSPFQLFHRPLTSEGSTVGDPSLRPHTADTLEVQLGSQPDEAFSISASGFYTYLSNTIRYFRDGAVARGRNADVELAGLEAETRVNFEDIGLSMFANVSVLLHDRVMPSQLATETDLEWRYSQFNTVTGIDRYPYLMVNFGVNLAPPNFPFNISVLGRVVGPRNASLTNNQLYTWNSLNTTYELDPYVTFDFTVSTIDLHWLSPTAETIITFGVRNVGTYTEAGFGGIDLPSSGPQVFLQLSQGF